VLPEEVIADETDEATDVELELEIEFEPASDDEDVEQLTSGTDSDESPDTDSNVITPVLDETELTSTTTNSGINEDVEELATSTDDSLGETDEETNSDSNSGSTSENFNNDASASTTESAVTSTTETNIEVDSSENGSASENSETATSSEDIADDEDEIAVTEAQVLVTEDNYYQFNRQACVAIGDGTFHCSVNTGVRMDMNAVVYAEMGEKLNMEIFLRSSSGEIEQLTSNDYDDTAPHYDAESRQIVWQRLIDDRYQIVLYDLEEGEERQLTFSRSNNMEPKVSDMGIVWQAWDGNDWEIMYFDGTFTDQLTSNSVQDVAPAIDDGYILWSVLGSEEQEAKVYSLASGEILNISGYEGGIIANPRFVLVYDTKFENGDIITQGFDPSTGLSEPIAAKAADDPIDIPDSDSTGETRALIQNKSSQEEEYDEGLTKKTPDVGSSSSSTATSTVASEPDTTLNLANLSPSASTTDTESVDQATSTDIIDNDILELTDFDLIIVPQETVADESDATAATGTASST
jgi:hypothetical protein